MRPSDSAAMAAAARSALAPERERREDVAEIESARDVALAEAGGRGIEDERPAGHAHQSLRVAASQADAPDGRDDGGAAHPGRLAHATQEVLRGEIAQPLIGIAEQ